MAAQAAGWASRIVGEGAEAPDQLLANPRNWRIHPKGQQQALAAVLDQVGWVQRVIVNRASGFVVDGHLRVSLAISRGEASVPVAYVDLTADEEALVLASLDPLAGMAVTDDAVLAELTADLQVDDAELAKLLGLSVNGHEPRDADEVPELPDDPVTRPEDLWLLGAHRLLCGDSTERGQVQHLMDGQLAEMAFTDPPHGVGYDGGTKVRTKLVGDESTNLYGPCCAMAAEFTTEAAALYLWHANVKGIAAAAAAAAAGYEIRCEIVWNKNQAQFGSLGAQYKQKHEACYYCFKRGHTVNWSGPTNEVTVWDIPRSQVNDLHPTQKPVALAERAFRNHSARSVLDLFGGSGSTLIAAETGGLTCYTMEIEPAYCDVIVQRWEEFTGGKAKRG